VHRKPPTGNNAPPPNERHFYKLDMVLAKCYDTSSGVGIKGRKMPEKKKKGGISLWWILLIGLVVVWLLTRIPRVVSAGAEMLLKPEVKPTAQGFHKATSVAEGKVPPSQLTKEKEEVSSYEVIGYVYRGKLLSVYLSNGDVLTEGDGVLRAVDRGRVKINNKWYTLKPNRLARGAPIVEKKQETELTEDADGLGSGNGNQNKESSNQIRSDLSNGRTSSSNQSGVSQSRQESVENSASPRFRGGG